MSRWYRASLRLLPRATRIRHGQAMEEVFAALVHDARRRGGHRAVCRAACREMRALLAFAWFERVARARAAPGRDERPFAWHPAQVRRTPMMASVLDDVRYTVRLLRRTPGFTLVAVATMALAIGANTAMFTIVNGVLVSPLPFPDSDRLVALGHHVDGGDAFESTTPGNFYDWREGTTAFDALAAWATTSRNLAGRTSTERVVGVLSAGSIFDVLRRDALIGRTFTAAEDGPGAEPVVVLAYALWQRLYGNDAGAVGQSLSLNGIPHRVIGIMPPDFAFPDRDAEYWIPARFDQQFRQNRDQFFLAALGRLADGIALEQARAQLESAMERIRAVYPQETANATAGVGLLKDLVVEGARPRLLTLMGAVVFILLIACANLGNLLLARVSERRREIALRVALGARPTRLVRQVLTESIVLAVAGGVAGFALGWLSLTSLVALLPADLPRAGDVRLDPVVFAFTLGVSMIAGLLFGVAPALFLARSSQADPIRDGSRGSANTRRVRTALVVSEVALALVLLAGAGLLVRSFANLVRVDPGFRHEQLLTFRVAVGSADYASTERRFALFDAARERFHTIPGVSAVAMTTDLPVTGRGTGAWFNLVDRPLPPNQTPPGIAYRVVGHDALTTLGIPLLAGRHFTRDDRRDGIRAVIVSEAVAKRFWPGDDPLGERIYLGTPYNKLVDDAVVVGIVGDVKQTGLDDRAPAAVYVPHAVMPSSTTFAFALRTSGDPASVTSAVREQVRQLDPSVAVFRVATMESLLAQAVQPARSSMLLVGAFALLALGLAVLGVFSVLAYTVSQRTTELGIRLALGAEKRHVAWLVLGSGLVPVVVGVALGMGGALVLTRFMASLLFDVSAADPPTLAAVAALVLVVASLASIVPARRAMRVNPLVALREG